MSGMMIKGAVDSIGSEGVVGWLYGSEYSEPPIIRAFLNHDMIGETIADTYRPDLQQVGFGDGRCGFDIRFNRPIDRSYLPFVTVRPIDLDLSLPVATGGIAYLDLIRSLASGHTGAGRNRSVLGGLWTDRTDAPQLLAGRVAVGACAAGMHLVLQELIRNGHVVLHNALVPNGVGSRDLAAIMRATTGPRHGHEEADGALKAALTTISTLLFRDMVVRVLRAAFDDQPVVYRLDSLNGTHPFAQASVIERLPSPAECLAIYIGHPNAAVQIDFIRNSHELPEFGISGRSRWTSDGAGDIARLTSAAGLSIETLQLTELDVVIVGPGLVHRVTAAKNAPALRAIAAPRRVTPARFMDGESTWTEVGHVSGARIKV